MMQTTSGGLRLRLIRSSTISHPAPVAHERGEPGGGAVRFLRDRDAIGLREPLHAGRACVQGLVRAIRIDPPLSSLAVLTKAARRLGMTPRRIAYRIRTLNIEARQFRRVRASGLRRPI